MVATLGTPARGPRYASRFRSRVSFVNHQLHGRARPSDGRSPSRAGPPNRRRRRLSVEVGRRSGARAPPCCLNVSLRRFASWELVAAPLAGVVAPAAPCQGAGPRMERDDERGRCGCRRHSLWCSPDRHAASGGSKVAPGPAAPQMWGSVRGEEHGHTKSNQTVAPLQLLYPPPPHAHTPSPIVLAPLTLPHATATLCRVFYFFFICFNAHPPNTHTHTHSPKLGPIKHQLEGLSSASQPSLQTWLSTFELSGFFGHFTEVKF